MKPATVHVWIWTLLYGGLLAVGLGMSVRRSDDTMAWALIVGGLVVALIGVALIVVRSRMGPDNE